MVDKQEIFEKHPELFHYTNHKGLVGILTSQNLRATHYRFLNDTTELQLMRVELGERLFPFVKEQVVEVYRQASFKKKREMQKAGGAVRLARNESMRLADSFYKTAFEDTSSGRGLAIPYITSFCAHSSDQPYEQKNGLLSQWRGYARGGVAVRQHRRGQYHVIKNSDDSTWNVEEPVKRTSAYSRRLENHMYPS